MTLRSLNSLGTAIMLVAAASGAPLAQITDGLDFSELEQWRLQRGNILRLCQFDGNPTAEFDRRVGEAIGQRLLLNTSFTELGDNYGIGGEYAAQDIYVSLVNDCDIILGMGIGANLYPPEFITTRPYAGFDYVGVAVDDSIGGLPDISGEDIVGAPVASYGLTVIGRYFALRPESQRPRIYPYGTADLMLTRLRDGTIDAMVIYGPILTQTLDGEPAEDIATFPLAPEAPATVDIGGLMLAESAYLRSMVDEAITAMIADGSIKELIEDAGFGDLSYTLGGN